MHIHRRTVIQSAVATSTIAGLSQTSVRAAPKDRSRLLRAKTEADVAWRYGSAYSALQTQLRSFLGRSMNGFIAPVGLRDTANLFSTDRLLVADQARRIFDGPCYQEAYLPSGYRILGASLPDDTAVKGFVLTLGNSVTIRAVAFFHYLAGDQAMQNTRVRGMANRSDTASMMLDRALSVPRSKVAFRAAYMRLPALTVVFQRRTGEDVQLAREIAKHVQNILKDENSDIPDIVKIRRFKLQTALV